MGANRQYKDSVFTKLFGDRDNLLERNVLKKFFEYNSSEVVNMLLTEWNWDDAKRVWEEEGIEKGIQRGKMETAKSFKNIGISTSQISQATGLSIQEIERL